MGNYITKKTGRLQRFLMVVLMSSLSGLAVYGQNSVSGLVVDEENEPLIGVNVLVVGSNQGTATDIDGRFTLQDVEGNATLTFSYIGYQTQEVELNGRTEISVTLLSDSELLDEVIIVGYGTRTRQSLTGSVVNVNTSDLKKLNPSNNITNALQGMIPGVVANTGNTPGSGANIQIRGIGTINNTSPLIIVDGVPSGIGHLNPAEIESMSV